MYEKERYSTQSNYMSKKPMIYEREKELKMYNEKNYRNIMGVNSKNYMKEKNNSQIKKTNEKINSSYKSQHQIIYPNSKRGQSQEDLHNKRTSNQYNQKFSINIEKINISNENVKSLNKENKENGSNLINDNKNQNKNTLNQNYSPMKSKDKIEEKNKIQNEGFKSPYQKINAEKINEYKDISPELNIEICKTCGKPKKPKGGMSAEKSRKIIIRELIGEKSNNDYVIRYGMENETQNEPFFETFSAPGTHFCPIHGYV